MRVVPLTDFPERFLRQKELNLYSDDGEFIRCLHVRMAKFLDAKREFLVEVEEFGDRGSAESLRGMLIKVAKEHRAVLPDGQYWIEDIVGLAVKDLATGEVLGEVIDVLSTGANDIYVVKAASGEEKLLPAIRDVVRRIDLDEGVIEVTLIEGLWE
jgi:16S rRNA processing protein RimM